MTEYCRNNGGNIAETMEEHCRDDDGVLQGRWLSTTGKIMDYYKDIDGVPQERWWSTLGTMAKYSRVDDGVLQG